MRTIFVRIPDPAVYNWWLTFFNKNILILKKNDIQSLLMDINVQYFYVQYS
jgi:hypothetical protein